MGYISFSSTFPTSILAGKTLKGNMNGLLASFLGNKDLGFGCMTDGGFVEDSVS